MPDPKVQRSKGARIQRHEASKRKSELEDMTRIFTEFEHQGKEMSKSKAKANKH